MGQTEKVAKPQPSISLEVKTDQERRRMFLRYLNRGWLILGIITLVTLPLYPQYRGEFALLLGITFPTYFVVRFFNLSGRTWLAGAVFTVVTDLGLYALFLVLVRELGPYPAFATQATVWMLMGLAVLFGGALIHKSVAPVVALFNTILLIATRLLIAPGADPRPSAVVFWWLLALTIWLYEGTLGNALRRVWTELAERKKAEERLIEAEQRYLSLANIERVLSEAEQVGIEKILQLIVSSAKELIPGAEHAVLHLIDEDQKFLVPRAVAGFTDESRASLKMHMGEGIAGQVIQGGTVIGISDTQSDSRFMNRGTPVNFRSIIVAPIQSNERCVGTISVQSALPGAFTKDESQLLGAFGTQAAIALANANLLDRTQTALNEINALYHVTRGLASSLDPHQLLKDVVDLLMDNLGYYHVQSYLADAQSGDMLAWHGNGNIGDQLQEQAYRLPEGAGIVGHVFTTGLPFVTNSVDEVVFFVRSPLLPDTTSELAVPIKIENRVVGVVDIQQRAPGRLTTRDLHLVSAVADQLAVALRRAELYTDLQASLNHEKETRMQLIHSERLAVVGRLLASVSHELNNPLQAIQNALFLLKDDPTLSPQGRQDLELVLSETERMASLIGRLRASYRPAKADDFQEIQLNTLVEDVHALIATYMRHRQVTFDFCPDTELPVVVGVPDQIRQVILNLLMNAMDAMPLAGKITVRTEQLADQGKILLSISDTGSGIRPEILSSIFEPFVTDKETGTGLGLTITSDIIHQHQGEIRAENRPEGGAVITIWLPIPKYGTA